MIAPLHPQDRVSRFPYGSFEVVLARLDAEDLHQVAFDLCRRVVAQHIDGYPPPFGLLDPLGPLPVIVPQGHNHVSLGQVLHHRHRKPQHPGRLPEAALAHPIGIDAKGPRSRRGSPSLPRGHAGIRHGRDLLYLHLALLVPVPDLHRRGLAPEDSVDRLCDIGPHRQMIPVLDLHHHIERGRRFPLQDRFLGPSSASLLVAQGHRLDAPHQIAEGGVERQIVQGAPMGCPHQLHAPLRYGARGLRLQNGAYLVDHYDLRHVILHGLDHHRVLHRRSDHLHAPSSPYGRVGDIAVTPYLVAGIHDHHSLVFRQDPSHLAKHRRLPHAGLSQKQDAFPGSYDVSNDLDRPVDGPAHPAGQAHNAALPVPYRRDAMERALDASAVIFAEVPYPRGNVLDVVRGHLLRPQGGLRVQEPSLRFTTQIQDDLQQAILVALALQSRHDIRRKHLQQRLYVVLYSLFILASFDYPQFFHLCKLFP